MNIMEKYQFNTGIMVGTAIAVILLSIPIAALWTDNLKLKREQREWIKEGILQYHSTTGKIVPIECKGS